MKVKEIQGFFEVCFRYDKKFSRPPRYDRFDNPPYMKLLSQKSSDIQFFLEIFLEMLFLIAFGVPEKSVFTKLFRVLATCVLANFQDRLGMAAAWFIGEADIILCV